MQMHNAQQIDTLAHKHSTRINDLTISFTALPHHITSRYLTMSGRNTSAWSSFMKDVKESKGSAKVTEAMSMAELTSIATMLGCDSTEMVTKKKITIKINQHLAELEEKSGEKYLAKLEGLDSGSAAAAEEQPDVEDDQGKKRPPAEPAEDEDEPKRLKAGDDEEDTGDSMGKRKVASSSERLYEAKISPDSEIYQLEVASPLFATARDDLVAKWGKIAGEVFGKSVVSDLSSSNVSVSYFCLHAYLITT
jgi:hypothetical protein